MERPTLQQLQYLVAVADHAHFGRAAEACFVTQPALSMQVRELERRLAVQLVERAPRAVRLTSVGEEVVARARALLRDVDDLVQAASLEADTLRGALHLGIIPTMSPYLLPRVVQVVTNRFAAAELHLHEQRTADLLDGLRSGTLDLAVLAPPVDGADLVVAELGDDPFLLALPEHHPLAAGKGPVDVSVLGELRVLLLDEGHCLRDQAMAACRLVRARPADVQATSLSALVQMVAAGLGVTLLPASAATLEARPGNGVAVRRFRRGGPGRTIALVWRASSPRQGLYAELARLLRPVVG